MELKDRDKLNWMVQGSCSDMITVALEFLFNQSEVKVLPHFHEELVLDVLFAEVMKLE